MRTFSIGGRVLSLESPPVFLAEIGAFFGQDLGLAKEMLERIVEVGKTVPHQPMIFKTEVIHDAEICLPGDLIETYASKDGRVQQENYRALIERKILSLEQYETMFQLCHDKAMPFIVSVYDFKGADFAVNAGAASLKIASSNVVHIPLIRHCASKGLPLILDTGRATLEEVQHAVEVARDAGAADLVIEHSPDGHPALPKAHNLKILETYRDVFALPTGLSDHHVGVEMLYVAIALGANVLEKGVHVSPDDLDIDISHTMDMNDLPRVLENIYECWQAIGQPERDMNEPIEGVLGTSQRQGLVAAQDMVPGDTISLETVRFAFPCHGISVKNWDQAEGQKITQPVAMGQPVQWDDVQ